MPKKNTLTISQEETEDYLKSLVRYWRPRLGLQAWRINIGWMDMQQVIETGNQGQIDYTASVQIAKVRICPLKNKEALDVYNPIEVIVLHELIHLQWFFLDNEGHEFNETQYQLFETAIENTAWALYRERHNIPPGQGDRFDNIRRGRSDNLEQPDKTIVDEYNQAKG